MLQTEMDTMDNFFSLSEFEEKTRAVVSTNVLEYIISYPERGSTYRENEAAFQRIRLKQSIMLDGSNRDLSTTLLGEKVSLPIGLAPTGSHRVAWHDGEIGSAQGASLKGAPFILSNFSTCPMSQVARATDGVKWMQLFIFKNRDATLQMIKQAEGCGFTALVLTLDTAVVPWGRLPKKLEMPGDAKAEILAEVNVADNKFEVATLRDEIDDSITWKDLDWVMANTKLPVIVKGVMTSEDARMAVKHGAAGIIVSNHGGRQLDTVSSTIEALPEVVVAVDGEVEVYMDGGIRHGTDVLKALSLGARAVFIGRPVFWGLACGGATGVARLLTILEKQLDTAMALTGCRILTDITPKKLQINSSL